MKRALPIHLSALQGERARRRRVRLTVWRLVALLILGGVAVLLYLQRDAVREFWVDDTLYRQEIETAARRHGLDPALVRAVVFQESRFNAYARGTKGEIGLMQLLPKGAVADWARIHKKTEPTDAALCGPALNLEIGCWYLARAMARWKGYRHQTELALCQYNAGEARAKRWKPENPDEAVNGRISIDSTKKYVERIMNRYRQYKASEA